MTAGSLAFWPEPVTLQGRFDAWLRSDDGLRVYTHVRDRAFALLDRGIRHYGMKALVEAARFDYRLKVGPDADGFKINNSYTSLLARQLMADYPALEGFFETRGLTAA